MLRVLHLGQYLSKSDEARCFRARVKNTLPNFRITFADSHDLVLAKSKVSELTANDAMVIVLHSDSINNAKQFFHDLDSYIKETSLDASRIGMIHLDPHTSCNQLITKQLVSTAVLTDDLAPLTLSASKEANLVDALEHLNDIFGFETQADQSSKQLPIKTWRALYQAQPEEVIQKVTVLEQAQPSHEQLDTGDTWLVNKAQSRLSQHLAQIYSMHGLSDNNARLTLAQIALDFPNTKNLLADLKPGEAMYLLREIAQNLRPRTAEELARFGSIKRTVYSAVNSKTIN